MSICQTLEEVEEKLDTSQWVVSLEEAELKLFKEVKQIERRWVTRCEKAGCTAIRIDHEEGKGKALRRGRFVVLVPGSVKLPGIGPVISIIDRWEIELAKLVNAQGKQPTIGTRSASYPVWLGPGPTLSFENKPDYVADKITKTYYKASRSARMTPQAALDLLQKKITEKTDAVKRSEDHSDYQRAEKQRAVLSDLVTCLVTLRTLTDAGDAVEVRASSGRTCKLSVSGKGISFTSTNAIIGLVPCSENIEVIEQDLTERELPHGGKIFHLAGSGLDVVVRPKP